jgi:GNAT superfamily N-acetyltransferase
VTAAFSVSRRPGGNRAAVESILADLPQWFGRPESNAAYAAAGERLPGHVATTAEGEDIGVALVEQHFPQTAEIHLIAVKARWHRQGVGRALLAAAEADLRAAGAQMLTVKTLGPSTPDEGYRRTREFYPALGFLPLEEFPDFWGPGTPCLFLARPLT